jgi:calcineurin-like phosphoesterase family protein
MKIFFTSDTYFGRKLTAKERGFSSDEDMLDTYIENWNKRVGPNDTVYHLGNFGWDPISTEGAMIHLQGKIYFLPAHYDSHLKDMSLIKINRHVLMQNQIAILPEQKVVMSHWPLLEWPGKDEGVIHVHGGNLATDLSNGNRFNVAINNWNSGPIELEFLSEMIEASKT